MDVVNGAPDVVRICASELGGGELVLVIVGIQEWGLRPPEHLFFTPWTKASEASHWVQLNCY